MRYPLVTAAATGFAAVSVTAAWLARIYLERRRKPVALLVDRRVPAQGSYYGARPGPRRQ